MQADRQRVAMVLVPARSSTMASAGPCRADCDSKGDTRGPVHTEKEARGTLEGCAGAAPATPWSLATRMRRARVPARFSAPAAQRQHKGDPWAARFATRAELSSNSLPA